MTESFVSGGLQRVVIGNGHVQVQLLPELGAKMVELRNERTGRQFLLEPDSHGRGYSRARYGSDFSRYDASGFDECFPTVAAIDGEGAGAGGLPPFPDHGELWSRPWDVELGEDSATLRIEGVRSPYTFEKRITLTGNRLHLDYAVRNRASGPLRFVWAAHPLLRAEPSARFLLPESVDAVRLDWASDARLGAPGATLPWPHLSEPGGLDYSVVPGEDLGWAVKCFTPRLDRGFAGIHYPETDDVLLFTFDAAEIPYVGLWLCYGGWPEDANAKHRAVALEPTIGRCDSLLDAMRRGEHGEIGGDDVHTWSLELSVWEDVPEAVRRAGDHNRPS